jgi:hypothetical protein
MGLMFNLADHEHLLTSAPLLPLISFGHIWLYFLIVFSIPFLYHALFVKQHPNGPPFLKGYLPYLGTAIPYLRNPEQFLRECQKKYGGIFTLYMGGKRMHIISDPISGIPTVYRNPKIFTFSVLANQFDITLFGVSEKQAKDPAFYKAQLEVIPPHLFASDAVAVLIKNFNDNLQIILPREIKKLDAGDQLAKGVVVDLDQWLKRIMFECSGRSIFGNTWPSDDEFFNDFYTWDAGVYSILMNYPSFMTKKAINARERYYSRMEEMFLSRDFSPAQVIRERVKVISSID